MIQSHHNKYALDVLEFEQVRNQWLSYTVSQNGKRLVEEAAPFRELQPLQNMLDSVQEMRSLFMAGPAFPLEAFADIQIPLKKMQVEGAFLQPSEFQEINHVLVMTRRIQDFIKDRLEETPHLEKMMLGMTALPHVEEEIGRIISQHGDVRDNASPELKSLRRSIQTREGRIRSRLDEILRSMHQQGFAQEDHLTLREGRLVVPMKDAHASHLKGVIVDQSASGATVFIEPFEILESNNEIRRLKIKEVREVERILTALTQMVSAFGPDLDNNVQILSRIDALAARARYADSVDGRAAETSERSLRLREARHPLLLLTHIHDEVVPISLEMGESVKVLIITGPNAGGKTVALKTVGLLALMHAYGLHVPAKAESQIPLFHHIFADIGDQQSIEQDLSTFSSHIRHIKNIIEQADKTSLVLMDEIGSATDPAEGSALATSILRHLKECGCLTIATTHMGALKVFAHEEPGVENGSMIFDQKSLKPTYRFQMGVPGSSYAFEIARRYGIPESLIRESQRMLGEDRGRLDQLILTLEQEQSRVHALLEEAERKDSQLAGLISLYQDRVQQIRDNADVEKQRLTEEAEKALMDANAMVERLVKEIRETSADRQVIRKVKKEIQTARKRVRSEQKSSGPDVIIRQGDWVLWDGYSGRGEVVSDTDRENRVLVQWGNIRLRVPVMSLKPAQKPSKEKPAGLTQFHVDRTVRDEIDLRGLTADEAIASVEQYLGDAHSTGFSSVRIIHGKGTGVLRREIGKYLKTHRLVKNQRLGNWNEGDAGVTVVDLK
ncbi:endonuclease MutS2 [bacterium]|nr:endonuclease MutS2 [bacterium]